MTLQEIFKDKPELLNEPCVQVLLEYVQKQHSHALSIIEKLENQEFKLLNELMHSEIVLIDGRPARETLQRMMDIFNN